MKKKRQLFVVLLLLVLFSSLIIHLIALWVFHQGNAILENYNEATIIRTSSLNEISTMLLSVTIYIFKNETIAMLSLNIFYQLLIVVLCYFMLSGFCNIYIYGIISMLVSVVLLITGKVYMLSNIYTYVIGVLIPTVIVCFILKRICLKKSYFYVKSPKYQDEYFGEEIDSVITLDDILKREKQKNETDDLIARENVQEAPMDMEKIQIVKEKNKIQFIENPLPVPKKKEHRQMDYAIDIFEGNDDFDIVDMDGMDFFDVE